MKQRPRIYYNETQKAMMWDRWRRGESLHEIARLFDRHHTSVRGILAETGGIRPPQRVRSGQSLSEREEIYRGLVASRSMRSIATLLGRAPSTVSREIRRNGGCHGYRASKADQAAWDQAQRPKICKLARNRTLAGLVARKLKKFWSRAQIAGWLKCTYPDDENYQVSHETISHAVHPSPWRLEKGALAAPATNTGHASLAPSHSEDG
jgi:DNA-binding CsgD family transcriptional regulator